MTGRRLIYEIRVQGHLDQHWAGWIGDARVARNDDGTTTFVVSVPDQAAVRSALAGLLDIGVTLLSLRLVTPCPGNPTDRGSTAGEVPLEAL